MIHQNLRLRTLLVCAIFVICFAANVSAQFKQLAGPAEEISSMRLPDPATLGNRSKAAMIPIKTTNGIWTMEFPVDYEKDFKLVLLAPNSRDWDIKIAMPKEDFIDLRQEAWRKGIEIEESTYGFDGENFPAEVFTFAEIQNGKLRVQINTRQTKLNSSEPIGYLVASSSSPYKLYSYVNTFETSVGNTIGFVASLYDYSATNENDIPTALNGTIQNASVRIKMPNGKTSVVVMYDNGNHADTIANDGILNGNFTPTIGGKYLAQITVRGVTPDGNEFIRTSEHLIEVASTSVRINKIVSANMIDDTRFRIALNVNGLRAGQKVIGYAEVWGNDENGNERAIAWISGMALTERKSIVPMTLDSRWIARSNAKGTFELRNVRIQDPDTSIVLASSDRLPLPYISIPKFESAAIETITDDMRKGVRPAQTINEAVGGKVMLIHGYCSGGNTFPTSQFTNYAVFSDPNQNRSHDQFAQRILNYGAQFPSFGAVAHSQGGAASLHLYTYYWSGLDYATGSRLIQTVGTPYQGTALAGNLALLGQIFGAGCGANNDLSYSGASAWLAGIPTWARAKVYYYSTSFTDVWWRYDYCNIATDLFLSDPDDGVVERAKAQLSSANNMGHKTGWCHTSGMRDPAQTSDSSRNATMNTNAAR